ncbi:MAG: transposase [Parafilimonas sp.]|nr:transposase [Parafilimonas sp.]
MSFNLYYPDFYTATILEWKPVLQPDKFKDIIINSLQFLVENKRINLYAFVIMRNHIHVIWQIADAYKPQQVQQSFMKFTAQLILKELRNNHPQVLKLFQVDAKDRKYQIWERNALSIPLFNRSVFLQKLDYIHNNPVKAGVCVLPEVYTYSSASFYINEDKRWNFLTHYEG